MAGPIGFPANTSAAEVAAFAARDGTNAARTPTRRAKPAGVIGTEIWMKVDGPPPVDPDELTILAVDTRATYTRDHDGSQGSKPTHQVLRWVNSRGEVGTWSSTVTATIGE